MQCIRQAKRTRISVSTCTENDKKLFKFIAMLKILIAVKELQLLRQKQKTANLRTYTLT